MILAGFRRMIAKAMPWKNTALRLVSLLYPAVALALLLNSLPAHSEEILGSIRGRVVDPGGAPSAGVTVLAQSTRTGTNWKTVSGHDGAFEFRSLVPGIYDITVEAGGTETKRRLRETIAAGKEVFVELALQQGSAPTDARVPTSTRPAAEGATGAPSQQINESQLVGLPLNGRSYSQLATLQAGVTDTSAASASRGTGGGSLTVSGSRPTSNNFLLDGTNIMDSNNTVPRSAAGVQLGSDAILQVQVFSSLVGPEWGRGAGGVLNSITRSGTPQFHGTFFEYFRNSKLDARNFFDPGANPPPFKRNQFGFTITGPVKKDQTFFLASVEVLRDRLSQTQVDRLPNEEARLGLPDANGNPTAPVAPSVRPYLDLYPLPNSVRLRDGISENRATVFLPTNDIFFSTRVDHKISDKGSLFVRYTRDKATSRNPGDPYLFQGEATSQQQYATAVVTHIFSLSTLTALRMGYTRPTSLQVSKDLIQIPPSLYFVPGAAKFGLIQVTGLSSFGPANAFPDLTVDNTFQFSDDVVMQRRGHALKFGAQVHRYRWDSNDANHTGGVWTFNSLENFLQAGPSGTSLITTVPGGSKYHAFRQTLVGMYFQDAIAVRPNLQLSLGLRYEYTTLIRDRDGRSSYVDDVFRSTGAVFGPYLAHNPSGKQFEPRIGITWSPASRNSTNLSWGFGLYHDPLLRYIQMGREASAPYYNRGVQTNFDARPFFPNALAAIAGAPYEVRFFDYNHPHVPVVLRYTFSLQQQLPRSWRVQATYVGARGNHLLRGYDASIFPLPVRLPDGTLFFPPDQGALNPAFGGGAKITTFDGQSFFNALQLSTGKTFGGGASLQANYTFSKSVDDASNGGGEQQYGYERTLNRGLSDFDLRHRLSLNFFYSLPSVASTAFNSRALATILGGWRVGGITSLRSGTPFTATVSVRTPRYLYAATQPDLIPGRSLNPTSGTTAGCKDPQTQQVIAEPGEKLGGPDLYFDPCSFAVPAPGTIGNVGRNTLTSPQVFNLDLSLQRDFVLGSEKRLQFRAEMFNVPNHANFGRPSNGVFSGTFPGRPNPTAGRITSTNTTSRQIQFALRLSF